jgi:hypothetical protein
VDLRQFGNKASLNPQCKRTIEGPFRIKTRKAKVALQEGETELWKCENCGHENADELVACKNCGTLRNGDIGDSGDNRDSEDLFFDDEYL